MLTHIHIKNYALVESLSLDFEPGLSVLTGETGAGKSIWIDALNLALGQRADPGVIRHGQTICDISVCFAITKLPEVQQWLQQHDFNEEQECIIRRIIQRDGPSRCSVNGHPCSLHLIRELSLHLVIVHCQHHYQHLMKASMQRQLVDNYAHHQDYLNSISQIHQQWLTTQRELDQLKAKSQTGESQLELLRYHREELLAFNQTENEWHQLSQQHQKLHNAKHLISTLKTALQLTADSDNESATSLAQQTLSHLDGIEFDDPELKSIRELLNTAIIHLQEANASLRNYFETYQVSPEQLKTIESRLNQMHDLARKHHVNPENLNDVLKSLEQQIQELEHIDTNIELLSQAQQQRLDQYQKISGKLTRSRNKAATFLSKQISRQMQQLGMEGGEFLVKVISLTQSIHAHGQEELSFWMSANPGQALQPLNKVASGGELSRISLILQALTAKQLNFPSIIFDEVDAGIGGETAHRVAELLQQLAQKNQVLCITHLAQIAARGQVHFQVTKHKTAHSTKTQILKLNHQQRIQELSRMFGGNNSNHESIAHATALLTATKEAS